MERGVLKKGNHQAQHLAPSCLVFADTRGSWEEGFPHWRVLGERSDVGSSELKMPEFSAVEVKLPIARLLYIVCEPTVWVIDLRIRKYVCFLLV